MIHLDGTGTLVRLRHTLAASGGALALTAVLAAPAHAATGEFNYVHLGLTGPQSHTLYNPPSGTCVQIPEAADPYSSLPAVAPHNDTDSVAVVFTEPDCTGDSWTLRPHGNPATDQLELRSVVFLPH
ncbi:hypothetical protein [Streptomyces cavernicola]|uniref:Secreted protein n=1 Tax=Streptomyces cavernicola TaxID=3043613 RepID=A0ABT6SC44_9ACTN|nr:hypothetical protein [Streptomyces sp. B-S-A6]MDI3405770.1 hypothetical protein [Streptomyces sp. B-S-A6]